MRSSPLVEGVSIEVVIDGDCECVSPHRQQRLMSKASRALLCLSLLRLRPSCPPHGLGMGNRTSSNRELLDAGAVKLVEEAISHNCVVIFSKTSCPFCTMAKNVFSDINVAYTVIELDMQENGSQLQAVLHQMTGDRTVPRVFVNGTCIGGGTDTRKLHQQGKLLPLIQQCAASYEH